MQTQQPDTDTADKELNKVEAKNSNYGKDIVDLLLENKMVSPDQIDIATKEKNNRNLDVSLDKILIKMGFITEGALAEVIKESSGVDQIDINSVAINQKLIKIVPKEFAKRNKILPLYIEGSNIVVAVSDAFNILVIDQIKGFFPPKYNIKTLYCPEADIVAAINKYYEYNTSIDGILKEIEQQKDSLAASEQSASDDYRSPTVRLVDAILQDAVHLGASDIHFEPEGFFLRLRYRIDGKMEQIRSIHKDYWPAIVVRIKIMAKLNITETRRPQDGRINATIMGRRIDFRVSSQPTINGENIVMRILDEKGGIVPMEKLGFSEYNETLIKKLVKRPEGVIILTGPTGSGKTTTLYSILNYINSIDKNIMTLEDPVEYNLPLVRQSNVHKEVGVDFASGIRAFLRQDPDVILIGEIRDHETAEVALQAAMTGHQVYSSLHTNDALGAIPRLLNIGVAPYLLSGSLIGVIAQRLARKICPHCRKAYEASDYERKILGKNVKNLYRGAGCSHCRNSGYSGRTAIIEIVSVSEDMDELISLSATRKEMMTLLLKEGFKPMMEDGIDKVLKGITTIDELIRVVNMTSRM